MSEGFFVSWQLWEQMTFVLASAIVLIFCLGWAKLWWTLRRNKKQVVIDEEKRIKIQHLRTSGVIIKLDQENHVPFGVRALQSGVEIDGIWVSKLRTKMPDSLKQLQDSDCSSPSSILSNEEGRPISAEEFCPPRISFSGHLEAVFRSPRVSINAGKTVDAHRSLMLSSSSRDHTYKPRRSSHLRFSSSGDNQVNQETLSRLEGSVPTIPESAYHKLNAYKLVDVVDSSSDAAADSEHSSGSDSDSSQGSKDGVAKIHQPVRRTSFETISRRVSRGRHRCDRGYENSATGNGLTKEEVYISIAPKSHSQSELAPTSISDTSLDLGSTAMKEIVRQQPDGNEVLVGSQMPLTSSSKPGFTPGSLHANKTARKVNSGFEILPAGHFSSIPKAIIDASDGLPTSKERIESNKRQSKKLQKRGRDSFTGKLVSTKPGNS